MQQLTMDAAAERLRDAVKAGRRFSVIRSIVEAHPEAVTTEVSFDDDHFHRLKGLAIHWAYCYYTASLRVIQYLVRRNPESLAEKDGAECLPLHYACMGDSIDQATVRFLVEENPQAVMEADPCGGLPIHHACKRKDSSETVRFLVESNPQCVRCADISSFLPLHYACESGASFELVKLLVDSYPQGVQMTDMDEKLPLHFCCLNRESSFEIIRLLVETFPRGASQRTRAQWLPVQFACANRSTQPEMVQCLIDAFPESLVDDEVSGNHLLHCCCIYGNVYGCPNPDLVRYFIQQYPEALNMRNKKGALPLHMCADFSSPNLEIVAALIEADRWALIAANVDGKAPLDLHLDALNQASDNEHHNEDDAPNAQRMMEDGLRRCIQEMRQSFCQATLQVNIPNGIVNHIFDFAVPHIRSEAVVAE